MLKDSHTNKLYLSALLRGSKYLKFFKRFEEKLTEGDIQFELLENTSDIWARDYMPIQIEKDKFVQFVYNPSYLKKYPDWVTNVNPILSAIGVETIKSKLLVDGGNVIKSKDTIFMCDRVFSENGSLNKSYIIGELEAVFESDKIIILPTDPEDEFGHADGVFRAIDNDNVLINQYRYEDEAYKGKLLAVLKEAKLNWEELPFNPYDNKNELDAKGIYLNYLQMDSVIFLPIFGMAEDEIAIKKMEEIFSTSSIVPILSNEIAKHGGVLNCISWNIKI
jgi:agmatine deiminase